MIQTAVKHWITTPSRCTLLRPERDRASVVPHTGCLFDCRMRPITLTGEHRETHGRHRSHRIRVQIRVQSATPRIRRIRNSTGTESTEALRLADDRYGTSDSCRARHNSLWQRERESVPVRRRCEAQADEARPFDDDPFIYRVDHVGFLLYQFGLLPGLGEGVEPFSHTTRRQVPGRLHPKRLAAP
jgi:hypothetical protein